MLPSVGGKTLLRGVVLSQSTFPSSFSCDRKLLLVTLALEHDADSVDMKERAKYLGRRSKAIDWISTDSYSLDQLLYLDH